MTPHVVIVGAGFGGLACAKELGKAGVNATIIDRRNYHLFVPLLYQVATAALSPADIAEPVRQILSRYATINVRFGEVVGVDKAAREVVLADGVRLSYDRLVIATGSVYNYFGHEDWADTAPGPISIDNARRIRARLLTSFEKAEVTDDPALRQALMTTVVIGGGPTGVEMSGAVAELARYALARDFRRIDTRSAKIVLIEAGTRLLSNFPPELSAYAESALAKLGVTVKTKTFVEDIGKDGVTTDSGYIPASNVIWAAGVAASPAGSWLACTTDADNRIVTEPNLSVRGCPGVYALGDTALTLDEEEKPLPALAQVAKQQGIHLGKALAANLHRGADIPPFKFRNRGNTAIIGRSAAVFDFGRHQIKGRLAWLLWAVIHVYLLAGFQKRILVTTQWIWRYLTYQRGARLIMNEANCELSLDRKPSPSAEGQADDFGVSTKTGHGRD